ncbi:MAG: hypothetical protein SF002_01695 [Alphaproteobacteria bacterium]|nr:hypothetical protein [Alphaproteobacteria bacterium]
MTQDARAKIIQGDLIGAIEDLNSLVVRNLSLRTDPIIRIAEEDKTALVQQQFYARIRDIPFSVWSHYGNLIQISPFTGLISEEGASVLRTMLRENILQTIQNANLDSVLQMIEIVKRESPLPQIVTDQSVLEPHLSRWLGSTSQQGSAAVRPEDALLLARIALFSGSNSAAHGMISTHLPRLQLQSSIISHETFRAAFPDFSNAYLSRSQVKIALVTDPSRRLIEEDILPLFRPYPLLQVVRQSQSEVNDFTVVIRELALDQAVIAPIRRTVIVPSSEVDILVTALLLPRGAAVSYDVVESSAKIAFAYEISIKQNNREVWSRILRDELTSVGRKCESLRYQNVFGGVQSLSTYPNRQVESFCSYPTEAKSISELRNQIPPMIASLIVNSPQIQQALRYGRTTSAEPTRTTESRRR